MDEIDKQSSPEHLPRLWMRGILVVLGMIACVGLIWGAWLLEESAKTTKTTVSASGADDQRFVVEMKEEVGETVFIQCSEDRFEEAFQQFRESLDIMDTPLSVLGGPMIIAMAATEIPEDMEPAQRALIEVLKRYSPSRIILLAHDECLVYDTVAAWNNSLTEVRKHQLNDLFKAYQTIKEWLPRAKIEMYYAVKDGNRLTFNPLSPFSDIGPSLFKHDLRITEPPKPLDTSQEKE